MASYCRQSLGKEHLCNSPKSPWPSRLLKRRAFQQQRTGHAPKGVTVVLSGDTLVITLHGALSAAEKLWRRARRRCQLKAYHRQLFANSCEPLRQEIKRITGVDVRESAAEVEPSTGAVLQVFTTGTMVQVFLLAQGLPDGAWSGSAPKGVV